MDNPSQEKSRETATLAGGCFWCLEEIFSELRGVDKVESGYSGGKTDSPTYEQVSKGDTGHAETVQITFDPEVISFRQILQIFFTMHNPTTLNRQGDDVGTQYRSIIFFRGSEQQKTAAEVIARLEAEGIWEHPIVTEIVTASPFYPAEEYHRHYYGRNKGQPYCQVVIAPKLAKLRREYISMLKK